MNTKAWAMVAALAGFVVGWWRGWRKGTDEQVAERLRDLAERKTL